MRPTRRTILLAAGGLALAVLPAFAGGRAWPFWVVSWGALAACMGLDFALAPRARSLACTLQAPDMLSVGEPETALLRLQLATRRPVRFEAVVDVSERLREVEVLRGRLGAAGAELELPLSASRRGAARIEAITVRWPGPLGLLEVTARRPLDHELGVVPNVLPVRRAALRFLADRRFQAGLKIEKYKGDGTEFDSLREFVEGDDTRTIHWRATARHRSLLCRQFRAERNNQVMLAVDSGRLMSEPLGSGSSGTEGGGVPKLDHAVTAALLLAYIGLKSGDRIGLYSFDARAGLFVPPQGGMAHYRAGLARMSARIEYSDAETNFTLGLTSLVQRLRRRSLVIVLTDFVDTVTAELMVENLERAARRHVVVFVSLRDPELAALAHEAPVTVFTLHRAVVAYTYLHDRHLVFRRLERLGVFTIDAEPSRMGPELVNRYLDIKRRELV